MITIKRGLLVLASVVAACTIAALPSGIAATQQPGPIDATGEINGAPFRIIVPADLERKAARIRARLRGQGRSPGRGRPAADLPGAFAGDRDGAARPGLGAGGDRVQGQRLGGERGPRRPRGPDELLQGQCRQAGPHVPCGASRWDRCPRSGWPSGTAARSTATSGLLRQRRDAPRRRLAAGDHAGLRRDVR